MATVLVADDIWLVLLIILMVTVPVALHGLDVQMPQRSRNL